MAIERTLDRCEGGLEKCKKEKGSWLAAFCRRCPKYKARPSPYVNRLLRLRLLRLAGFPFEADSMPLDTWIDLGVLESILDSRKPMVRLF